MAAGYFKQFVLTKDVRRISVCGKISLDSSGNVTVVDVPMVTSVTKTGAGLYTLNLSTHFTKTRALIFHYQSAQNSVQVYVSADNSANTTTPNIQIRITESGVTGDVSTAGDIHCIMEFKDSGVKS